MGYRKKKHSRACKPVGRKKRRKFHGKCMTAKQRTRYKKHLRAVRKRRS